MADVNYQLTMSLGLGSTDPRPLAHNLVAIGEVEAVEDFFFLGANAGARLGGSSSFAESIDAINFNADRGSQSFSVGLMPRFVAHLNRYVDLVTNNAVNYVTLQRRQCGGETVIRVRGCISVPAAGVTSARGVGGPTRRSAGPRTSPTAHAIRTRSRAKLGVGYPINAHLLAAWQCGL